MTETPSATHDRLSTVRRYRRLFWGLLLVAVIGFLIGSFLDYTVLGVGVYWASVLGMLLIWKGTSIQLFDERERSLDQRASYVTLSIVAVVLIVVGPGQVVLSEIGYQAPPVLEGALWGYVAQFALFAVVYLALRFRT